MMPYFWVDVGIIGKVIEKVDDDLFIYETVVTKERATVTAKWVKEHLLEERGSKNESKFWH